MPGQTGNNPAAGTQNFKFLAGYDSDMVEAVARAEESIHADPVYALICLRQFSEMVAQEVAARLGLSGVAQYDTQMELLDRLEEKGALTRELAKLFHGLRMKGNAAVHRRKGSLGEAMTQLKITWALAIWFRRTFGDEPGFKTAPFAEPADPGDKVAELKEQVAQERAKVQEFKEMAEERKSHLEELQAQAEAAPEEETAAIAERVQNPEPLNIDELTTRKIIDEQLSEAGWEADTENLAYARGTRPIKGRNLAISEWPTSSGPADYVLFAGLTPVAVVEAKRKNTDVSGAIEQAKRYSRDYVVQAEETLPGGGPWGEYKIPFLFSTNGRPYLRQLKTKSGTWFLDARRATNHPRALEGPWTPEGLAALLKQDHDDAEDKLKSEPMDYLKLYDYQEKAVEAVEAGILEGKRNLLLAMATGTGKTRTALGIIYRLVKSQRFRRVLFLVDRTYLGEQAENTFKNVRLEKLHTMDEIYDVKGVGDIDITDDTRVHIATVQGMARRILPQDDDDKSLPVDRYDCIIVDEAHRGYKLDQEMSEGEMRFRSYDDYVSKYRQVLDHFDSVHIGLTATPALQTTEIFGQPIFEYTYREAVIEGRLVDHEPPIRIITRLKRDGIHWGAGEEVTVYKPATAQLDFFNTPDEIDIEIEGFNTKVITEGFNRVVCELLAEHIDPALPEKTLVFCARDDHADMVVTLLKEAFTNKYGSIEDDAVMKITGKADKPSQKIRRYKNERLPNVAVTVDLLTTGVDIHEICNLVFLRRVKSRILYEQMLGRATRLCPEIGKEFFRIYDAVDLYESLEDYTTMKPVATRPTITFAELAAELGVSDDDEHSRSLLDEFTVKFQQRKNGLKGRPLENFVSLAGMDPEEFIQVLSGGDLDRAREIFSASPELFSFLDELKGSGGGSVLLVSDDEDELIGIERGYGNADNPGDYLEGFRSYIEEMGNELPALLVVTQRPKDLTRKELKELRLKLEEAGYFLGSLRTAWREIKSQDIAASIMGFIRSLALGSPLIPYKERVEKALSIILARENWTDIQRRWLERIAKQAGKEIIVDRESVDRGQFEAEGGFKRLNEVFDGKLEAILAEFQDEVWKDAG
jgi:type I restriction enzyme R subunit